MSAPLTTFTDLARKIAAAHTLAQQHAGAAAHYAIEVGELLIEAKATLPHGKWLPWLRENLPFSDRTAQAYMRLATHTPPQMRSGAADLSVREVLAHVARPRRKSLDDELAAWTERHRLERRPVTEWTIEDARATADRIRAFDEIMHRFGICDGHDAYLAETCTVCNRRAGT
jgi:hypothetical protein